MSLKNTKIFCFEKNKKKIKRKKRISYMANACVRESVRTQDMRHGI